MESEKDLELIKSCDCLICNWIPRSEISKTERLTGEVKCKEWYRAFKNSITWNCKNSKASPTDLRLLDATYSLGNLPKPPTKWR